MKTPAKKKDGGSGKAPRTVQELAPWFNMHFGQLHAALQATSLSDDDLDAVQLSPTSREQAVEHLLATLHQLLAYIRFLLTDCAKPAAASEATVQDLTRAILVSGGDQKFEPAIQTAIREYADTFSEIRRCSSRRQLPTAVRDDIIAGFTRILASQRQTLRLLDVTVEEIAEGTPLDSSRHKVVRQLTASDPALVNTVRACLKPLFAWKSAYGMERIEVAEVVAYTSLDEAEPDRQNDRGPKPIAPLSGTADIFGNESSLFDDKP